LDVLWVGSDGGMEVDLVKRAKVPFRAISAAGVHGVGLRALPGNLLRLARGYHQSRMILRQYRPEVLFFTGGYLAVPMALAGRRMPSVLYTPDIEPGMALKTLARLAGRIAVTADASLKYYPSRPGVVVTGYPTRPELKSWNPDDARHAMGLQPGLPTLLVYGGSKGARSINRALQAALPDLLSEMQVVHISGNLDWPEIEAARAGLGGRLAEPAWVDRYHAFPYLHTEMGAAFTVADLVVARAGASALGEFPLFGLPAILVPYPYAWRYQQVNAKYLVQKGAACLLADEDLTHQLLPVVRDLMRDPDRREKMRTAMSSLAQPDAAESIAHLLLDLASHANQEGM
jgi:UDP-N-acetylglucosamine:LPS N-acetylglucosamine transferase